MTRLARAFILLTLGVAAVVVAPGDYLTTDDWFLVSRGRDTGVSSLFERQTAGPPAIRPVSMALARLEHTLLGDEPTPRLLAGVALHGVAALCLVWLLTGLGRRDDEAWLAGALFAAWPLAAESLAWYHAGHTSLPVATLTLGALAAHAHRRC